MNHIYRFAPSPTGFLHVGGARTAIFNWLLARKNQGRFLLRIEDTDRSRSSQAYKEQIINSLRWLGIDWDGPVYYQSEHTERHKEVASQLLDSGQAYRCFCSPEKLEQMRKNAERKKINKRYDGTCRRLTPDQVEENLARNVPCVVRLKVPPGQVSYDDSIHGPLVIDTDTLDDFIILRADGSPVYQLAVVVDDHDMGITHIIRGDDHIANTPKQILIYQALGWSPPDFGHVPLILGPDKVRLSKRHGATSVEEFREQGILAGALFNYLCLLGWSGGDDVEVMNREEILRKFDISRIQRSAAVFDLKKLNWMNTRYLAALSHKELMPHVRSWLEKEQHVLAEAEEGRFSYLIELLQVRAKTITELCQSLDVFFTDPQIYEEKGVHKYFEKPGNAELLQALLVGLEGQDEALFIDIQKIEEYIRAFAGQRKLSAGAVIHPLRLALTGKTASPGIFELIFILGRERVLRRLKNALSYIGHKVRNVTNQP